MALFSRRTIQRLINEAQHYLRPRQISNYVRRFNAADTKPKDIILLEWELAVLSAFSRLGEVQHEPNSLTGRSKPDILFRPNGSTKTVVMDIVTVSDSGYHERNPYEPLMDELKKHIRNLRTKGIRGGFRIDVGSASPPTTFSREPIRLKLPPARRFGSAVFNENFLRFVDSILANPKTAHSYRVANEEADVSIAYDPRQTHISGGYPAYTVPKRIDRNPLANALETKALQLKRSGLTGPMGIVVCDGDCDMLRSRSYGSWRGDSFSVEDVTVEFLRRRVQITFVVVLCITPRSLYPVDLSPKNLTYDVRVFPNRNLPLKFFPPLQELLKNFAGHLPQPIRTPQNAKHYVDWLLKTSQWHRGRSHYGGFTMSRDSVKISARAVLDLLSGRLTAEQFIADHRFQNRNIFERMLRDGRPITAARFEPSNLPEDDDDWLVFEFGEPDAAISPFRVPTAPQSR